MRDYVFLAIFYASLPVCFLRPYMGILVWTWISLMHPHRFMWDERNLQPALLVAAATLAGCFFMRDGKKPPFGREVVLLCLLYSVFTLSTIFALVPDFAWERWRYVSKFFLMSLALLVLSQGRQRLQLYLLVVCLSIGYYGVRGGLQGLRGDFSMVWGPEYSAITDNNTLALAELMILPLLLAFAKEARHLGLKWALYSLGLLNGISIILSYSRAAFLGLLGLGVLLWLRSERKLLATALLLLSLVGARMSIPAEWYERISTIGSYREDPSAFSRVRGAFAAWNVAIERPWLGGGFGVHFDDLYTQHFPPVWCSVHQTLVYYEIHISPLQILADHGFIGLALFLGLVVSCFRTLRTLRLHGDELAQASWIRRYATGLEGSLTVYLISGAFHPVAYFELFYDMVSAVILLKAAAADEYLRNVAEDLVPTKRDTDFLPGYALGGQSRN